MSEESDYLKVFPDRSELHAASMRPQVFHEGPQSQAARSRYNKIKSEFDSGFLEKLVSEVKANPSLVEPLDPRTTEWLEGLVNAVSSERGRAIVALTVMQLSIKSICPEQSIRLHKGATRHGGDSFSWREGISMRSLDKNYVTPALRRHDLVRLNADGFMMTRSLAENYPYSKLYKAALRGGRVQWLHLLDAIDTGKIDPNKSLRALVALLLNRTEAFEKLAAHTLELARRKARQTRSVQQCITFIQRFVDASSYSARIFEIAMHSLFQVLDGKRVLPHHLKPLSQMRSANKKHGNVGDVELTAQLRGTQIIESWDAKYGKPYLRDELDELDEKLLSHPETELAGFVVDAQPTMKAEIKARRKEIEESHGVSIPILSFPKWVEFVLNRADCNDVETARAWLLAFTEVLCQKRREQAPIDEPCNAWVSELAAALDR